MSTDLIGDREHRAELEQRIRDGIVAFAAYLAGVGTGERVVDALCPADVDEAVRASAFADLLHIVDTLGPDRTDLPFDGQVDLDYMTGVRR